MEIRIVLLWLWLPSGHGAGIATAGYPHASQVTAPKVMRHVLASGALSGATERRLLNARTPSTPTHSLLRSEEGNTDQMPISPLKFKVSTGAEVFHPRHDLEPDVIPPYAGVRGVVLPMHTKSELGQDCPVNTVPISSQDECDEAQKKLGGFNGIYPARKWGDWPQGCFHYVVDDGVFYNAVSMGDLNPRAERYCHFAAFSSSNGDCAGSQAPGCLLNPIENNVSSVDDCGALCLNTTGCAGFRTPKGMNQLNDFVGDTVCWTFTGSGCIGNNGVDEEKPAADCYTFVPPPTTTPSPDADDTDATTTAPDDDNPDTWNSVR